MCKTKSNELYQSLSVCLFAVQRASDNEKHSETFPVAVDYAL